MNANKVILNGEVLIDLTMDTVTEKDVALGKTFHKADGSEAIGSYETLVLQEKTVTLNGEVLPDEGYDGLSKVTVNVPVPNDYIKPSGTKNITENGTHNVTEYASVIVNVLDSPLPIEVETANEMNTILQNVTAESVGAVYKYLGESTDIYENGELYIVEVV